MIKFLSTILLVASYSLSNTLCQYHYGPQKEELSIIQKALSHHVNKKNITPSFTHKALLHFVEILDPNNVLFYADEIRELTAMSSEDVKILHHQVLNQKERTFHQNMQAAAAERMGFLLYSIAKIKDVRNEVLRRIPLVKLNQLEIKPTVYPKDKSESLNFFMNYLAETASKLKHDTETMGEFPISEKEALVMAIRMVRNDFSFKRYFYNPDFLPSLIAKSYIDKFDAHSELFLPHENRLFINRLFRDDFYGLGIEIKDTFKGAEILAVTNGGGADSAGIHKGDIITHFKSDLNWVLVRNMNVDFLSNEVFPGFENSSIQLRILRDGKYKEKTIYRKLTHTGKSALDLKILPSKKGNIAHIRLDMFYQDSSKHLAEKLQEAITNKAQGLVLDLRGNGGGSADEMIKILGLFVSKGPAIVLKVNGDLKIFDIIPTEIMNNRVIWTKPLIVLTDKLSASASEGLSGALQDYGRAIIVGADKSTYGKGSMQQIFNINNDMSLKLTITLFSSPNGGHKQFDGVTPDIIFKSPEEKGFLYERELEDAIIPNGDNYGLLAETSYMPNRKIIIQSLISFLKTKSKMATTNETDLVREESTQLMEHLIDLLK